MKAQLPVRVRWAARIAQFCCGVGARTPVIAKRRRDSFVWLRLILAALICLLDLVVLVPSRNNALNLAAILIYILPLVLVLAGAARSRLVEGVGWVLLLLVSL